MSEVGKVPVELVGEMSRVVGQAEYKEEEDVEPEDQTDTGQKERMKDWRSYEFIVCVKRVIYTKGRVYTRLEQLGHMSGRRRREKKDKGLGSAIRA